MSRNPADQGKVGDPPDWHSKTITGALWLVLWRFFTRVIGFGSTLLLAHVLLPADFGLLGMATAFSAAVDGLSTLGLQEALVRRQSEETELYATAFTIQLGRSILTAVILALCAPFAAAWFGEPRLVSVVFVLAFATVVSGLENVGVIEFRRTLRYGIQFQLLLWPRLLQVMATVAAAFELRSYWALLIGTLVLKASRTILTYVVHPYRPGFQLAGWRELAGFSFWTWATALASLIWDRCDPFLLGPRLGSKMLGIYLLGGEIALLPVTEVIGPAAEALFAGFSAAQAKGVSSVKEGPRVAVVLLLFLIPVIIAISCASGDLAVGLLGTKWAQTQPVIAILTWACVCSPFSWVCSVVMVANNHVKANFAGNLAVSLFKLAVLILAIHFTTRIDLIAASAAICVAIESYIYFYHAAHHRCQFRTSSRRTYSHLDCGRRNRSRALGARDWMENSRHQRCDNYPTCGVHRHYKRNCLYRRYSLDVAHVGWRSRAGVLAVGDFERPLSKIEGNFEVV